MKNRRYSWMLFFLVCIPFSASALHASNQAQHWLQRMNHAVSKLNYDGHFVYIRGEMLDAMRLRHRVEEGDTREHLISLTGTAREVIRDNSRVTIIQTRDGKTHITQRSSAARLSPFSSLKPNELETSYTLVMGEDIRMAGRPAKVIWLQPKDNLRFACQLVLDKANALPLGISLFDEEGKQISRIMFTDLRIAYADEKTLASGSQEPAETESELTGAKKSTQPEKETQQTADLASITAWRFNTLPMGYQLINYHLRNKADGLEQMEHFVFSDGLATVSIYVEPSAETGLFGEAKLGAVNALGAQVMDHQITIVGEVPTATLKLLLTGAHLNAG